MTCWPALTGVRMTLSPTTTLSPLERSCKENALQFHNLCKDVWPCRMGTCRTSFPHSQMDRDSPVFIITLNPYWPSVPPHDQRLRDQPAWHSSLVRQADAYWLSSTWGQYIPVTQEKCLASYRDAVKTHNALNYGSLLTCWIWCGGAELHCHIVSHCPVPWKKIFDHMLLRSIS